MSKAATRKAQRGQYSPPKRSKPTTGDLGPRDPGPHGVIKEARDKVSRARARRLMEMMGFSTEQMAQMDSSVEHEGGVAVDIDAEHLDSFLAGMGDGVEAKS